MCVLTDPNCALNWKSFNQQCYLFDTNYKSRSEGSRLCQSSSMSGKGRLLSLTSQAEKVSKWWSRKGCLPLITTSPLFHRSSSGHHTVDHLLMCSYRTVLVPDHVTMPEQFTRLDG